ncbi:MAG: Tol-Pal system beta propeller repeat protein TolB [Legionellales bacterium]|nr:Tol-Pal system beta propeller repeat protein TolB [Legionellales bacterium]
MRKLLTTFGILASLSLLLPSPAYSALDIELTKGVVAAIPIAIVPFAGGEEAKAVTDTITSDLENSGRFTSLDAAKMTQQPHKESDINYGYWRKSGAEDIIIGEVTHSMGKYKVNVALYSVFANQSTDGAKPKEHLIFSQEYTVNKSELRRLSHHISDEIYQHLTGEKGIFSTRLAYVLVQRHPKKPTQYQLVIADVDGVEPRPILTSDQPIMSPAWSPDGKQVAYVSFENHRAKIYISDIATGKRRLVSNYPGINGAPAWSPDGKSLAMVLSKDGSPNIYIKNLDTDQLTQVTRDWAIDTEPHFAPDGKSLVYTSDRGGSPQVYQVDLASEQTQRLTFDGRYNARPSLTPDGKQLLVLHRKNSMFGIAMLDLNSNGVIELTKSGLHESPTLAPNGSMVAFATNLGYRTVLGMASTDGNVTLRLPDQQGDVQDPAWSPFLN